MKEIMRILMVEDVPKDAELVESTVRKAFPNSQFLCVEQREDYLRALKDFEPAVILSDYWLRSFDGMSALKLALQESPDTPFIIVTSPINEETAAESITEGAWDYVLKDHLARLGSVIKKSLERQKIRKEHQLALEALHESEERCRSIINFTPVGIGVYSEKKVEFINPAGARLLGADDPAKVLGRAVREFLGTESLEALEERLELLRSGQAVSYPVEDVYIRRDGSPVPVEVIETPVTFGNKPAVQVIFKDITERKRAEQESQRLREALSLEKDYLSSLIQNANTPIITWSPALIVTEFNHAFEELTGLKRADVIGMKVEETPFALKNKTIRQALRKTRDGKIWHNLEIPFADKKGAVRALLWNSANIIDAKGDYIATIVQGTDITARKKAEENNRYLSYHDHLTGLYNRRFFERRLKQIREGSELPVSVIMGDVNGLKLINDSFGHEAGDELLIKAAEVIRKGTRESDVVARLGGDEFGILLTRAGAEEAEKVIRRIKAEALAIDFDNRLLSISFGYATLHQLDKKIETVLIEAENSMYQRKVIESASMRNKTIDVIMNALYDNSDRERQHSIRVGEISADLAAALGFSEDAVSKIRMAGLVHDIGKIGISQKIMAKSGHLDDEDWVKIKKHPEAGSRILSLAKEFSDLAKQILYHHERWDGTGYPKGLSGEEIPIESRIIALADAFDAMTSSRPYREPMQLPDVIAELRRCAGKQFDAHLVDVFIEQLLLNSNKYGVNEMSRSCT